MKLPFRPLGIAALLFSTLYGCAPDESGTPSSSGGAQATGGGAAPTGGTPGSGGAPVTATGGATVSGSGGAPGTQSGGSIGTATGGSGSGGVSATGGNPAGTGGAPATGGAGGGAGRAGGAGGGAGRAGGAGGNTSTGGSNGNGGAGGRDVPAVPLDPALLSRCTGTNPIKCTIPVPANGNYTVTVELGSATAASVSRVQAENYRISVPQVSLAVGTFSQYTFSLNVRAEVHDGYSAVGKELNLLIDGSAPALHGLGYVAAPTIPTIFTAGDSTMCDWDPVYAATKAGPLERGWGQEFSQHLKSGIAMANYSDSGENALSFYNGFWQPAKALLRAGDYVFIQFGHNDDESAALYKTYLMTYVNDARKVGATPIIFSPVARKGATTANPGFAGLEKAAAELAAAENIAFVDLTSLAIAYYKTVPDKNVLFAMSSESTHFSEYGATQIGGVISQAIKASTVSLKDFLK